MMNEQEVVLAAAFSVKGKKILVFAGIALFMLICAARAGDIIKAANNDALNLGSSWTGGVAPGASDRAIYKQTGSAYTNVLGEDLSWSGIVVSNNTKAWTISASNTLTLGTNGIDMAAAGASLTINSAVNIGGAQTWMAANSRTLTVNGVVSGASGYSLTKDGTGTLTITNPTNTYSGGTILNAGTLQTDGNDNPLGTGALTLKSGSSLNLATGIISNAVVIPTGQNAMIIGNATLNGPISGGGSLTHGSSGAFKLSLGGDNSGYSGRITNTSTLSLKHKRALGTGTLYMKDDSGAHSSLAANADLTGFNAVTNNIVLLDTAQFGATSSTGEFELAGVISGNGGLIPNHSLVTVTLSGDNTYTNTTDIAKGGLIVNGSLLSKLITAASGTTLSGTGTVQSVVMAAGSMMEVGTISPATMNFHGNLTLAAGSTNLMKVFATNSYDILRGAGTNTLSAGGTILLDFTSDITVAVGDQFDVFQMYQNWSNVTQGAGISLATIGLPGSLAIDAPGFPSNGVVTVILSPTVTPIVLPDKYPISMTYHGPTPGTNGIADELLKYDPIQIMGSVRDGWWDEVRSNFPGKIVLKQDAWGGTVTIGMQSAYPGHWLLKTGTKLTANCSPTDTVLHVQDYSRLAANQAAVDNTTNNNSGYLLLYGLGAGGQPDWSRAEHVRMRAVDTVNGTITVDRAQQGSSPLGFTNGQAVIARHMMFWVETPGGQWQLNFSLQCPQGGPLNLTAAEWFARQIKQLIDISGADGVEFDVARWQWGGLSGNTMDCDNDLITDYGYIDGVQSFGLGGQVFLRELRKLLGPGKIIQMDSNDAYGQQRGWQYVNGCQLESFPNANDFSTFSKAFLHLRQYRDNITSLPNFSYAYVKTPTTTFENLYGTDGSNLDWHFRTGFAAGLLMGMPSPFTSIADSSFDPGEPANGTNIASTATGDIFYWDEYFGGDLNDWQWLGQPLGPAVQVLDNLDSSNLLSQAVWTWKTEVNFSAVCGVTNGEFGTVISALASVTNILPGSTTDHYSGTLVPKTLTFGNRLELTSGAPVMQTNQEYTVEFEARGNDRWDYAGQVFDKVPRMLGILTPQDDQVMTVLLNSNWGSYRLSFFATTNLPLVFGFSEQIGDAGIRNIRLFKGGAERWMRAFTNGVVLLNMTKQPWACSMPTAYRRLHGTQNPDINNGQRVPPTVIVPSWDALFLVKMAGTNIIVPAGSTFNFTPTGLLLGTNDTLSGWGVVTGNVTAASGAMIYPGTLGTPTGTLSFSNHLTLNGQTLTFDLTSNPAYGNDRIAVAGHVANNGITTISLNYVSGWLGAGTYTLMTYAATIGGSYALNAAYPNVTLNVGATNLTLTVGTGGSVGNPYIWRGAAGSAWDIAATANWLCNGQPSAFYDGVGVSFDDTASTFTVSVNDTVSPGSVSVNATNDYTLTGAGKIHGLTGLTKGGSGQLTLLSLNSYSGGTTVSGGKLTVSDRNALGTGALTINSNATASLNLVNTTLTNNITNAGAISLGGNGTLSGTLSGSGGIYHSSSGAFTMTLTGTNTGLSGPITNAGTMKFGTRWALGSGTIYLGDGVNSGSVGLNNSANGVTGANAVTNALVLLNGGTLGNNQGPLEWAGPISGAFMLTKSGNQTLILSGANTHSGGTTLSGGTLVVNGSLAGGTVAVNSGTTLNGSGNLGGPLAVESGGLLQPGSGGTNIATLAVGGAAALSGTLVLPINRTNAQNASKLAVGATLTLGGTLIVTNVGPALQAGDAFTLLSAGGITGAFNSANLPTLTPPLFWNTSQLAVNGTLSVMAPPADPPLFFAPLLSGANLVLRGTNGTAGNSYYVLTSTNVALSRESWTRTATNQFGPGGGFSFTNVLNPGEPAKFFLLRLP